ncbi:hypothetical protein [Halorubellus sp. PRR65]|uniref:hypothetical protein n=1 Tax=Halorubellus sp. PRR65 TaxID=3098148 RepID=UPI002B25EC84|nr:hypothetical protein [Halorubellus sp. PRR65]
MERYPGVPAATEVLPGFADDGGHLWVQELVAGELFRFQLRASGALRVGTRRREFAPDEAPLRFRHAVKYVRESLDASALRAAVEDVESVTFFGVATHHAGYPYEWGRTPSVLGVDVWDADREALLRVEAAERAFDAFGLDPVNVLRKEVHVRDYGFADESLPPSEWYDGAAAGVVVRKKTGERLAIRGDAPESARERDREVADASEAAARTVTAERFERVARTVRERDRPLSFDTVYDRLLAAIYREEHDWLLDEPSGGGTATGRGFALGSFRDAVAERASELLRET